MPLHTRTHARTGTRRLRRTATAIALTAALGVSIAACGDDADTADGPSGTRTSRAQR